MWTNHAKMSTYNTQGITPPDDEVKNEVSSLDERLIDYDVNKLIYVRRGSQRDSRRVIGRDNLNFDNSHLSKEHACFQYRNGALYVKDCGSTFGTTVNDKFIVANRWHVLESCDTIGLIVSKPSTWIAKIVEKFPDHDDIPLEEFSNPPIGLKLRFDYLDDKLKFCVVKDDRDHESVSEVVPNDVSMNETYDTDAYYFDNCLEVGEKHPHECACAERSCTEGNDDEVEPESKLNNNPKDTDKSNDFITHEEVSHLDCKDIECSADLDVHEPHLEISITQEVVDAKSENLDDDESCSFGHFTSELISDSDIGSDSDSLSGFSSSDSDSSSISSSSSSSNSSSSTSDESEPELDTSIIIANINSDDDCADHDCTDHDGWSCQNFSSFTNSNSEESTIYGLPHAIVPVLDRTGDYLDPCITSESSNAEGRKKRSFDEYQDDIQSSDEEHESKKVKLPSTEDKFAFKSIAKEVVKGALYALATITALGVYGSTIDNQE